MADSKVKVRIYGQEYTIVGERKEEQSVEIANYVDKKMREIAQGFTPNGIPGSLAVLAAINIADEYFAHIHDNDSLKQKNEQLEKDCASYMKMWDEAKRNFAQYKESSAKQSEDQSMLKSKIKELEAKCQEYESSYFDVQMENIQLKDQLGRLKK